MKLSLSPSKGILLKIYQASGMSNYQRIQTSVMVQDINTLVKISEKYMSKNNSVYLTIDYFEGVEHHDSKIVVESNSNNPNKTIIVIDIDIIGSLILNNPTYYEETIPILYKRFQHVLPAILSTYNILQDIPPITLNCINQRLIQYSPHKNKKDSIILQSIDCIVFLLPITTATINDLRILLQIQSSIKAYIIPNKKYKSLSYKIIAQFLNKMHSQNCIEFLEYFSSIPNFKFKTLVDLICKTVEQLKQMLCQHLELNPIDRLNNSLNHSTPILRYFSEIKNNKQAYKLLKKIIPETTTCIIYWNKIKLIKNQLKKQNKQLNQTYKFTIPKDLYETKTFENNNRKYPTISLMDIPYSTNYKPFKYKRKIGIYQKESEHLDFASRPFGGCAYI